MVASVDSSQTIVVLLNEMNGTRWQLINLTPIGVPRSVATGDIDGDGDDDIVYPIAERIGDAGMFWIENLNNSGQSWRPHPILLAGNYTYVGMLNVVDMDSNGAVDLVIAGDTTTKLPLTVLYSNVNVTIQVQANGTSCTFNVSLPICPTLQDAVALAHQRPTVIELVDDIIFVDQTIIPLTPVLTIVGQGSSQNNTIVDCGAASGTCLFFDAATSITLQSLIFTKAANISVQINDTRMATVQGCSFIHNSGVLGGAMHVESSTLNISNCSFDHNYANTSGGGLFLSSSTVHMTNVTFTSNCAVNGGGGAIYWEGTEPVMESIVFEQNGAVYGSDLATDVKNIQFTIAPAPLQESGMIVKAMDGSNIILEAIDFYQNRVVTAPVTFITFGAYILNSTVEPSVNGWYYETGYDGMVNATELKVFAAVGQYQLVFVASSTDRYYEGQAPIEIEECKPGSFRDLSTQYVCTNCPAGEYSDEFESSSCQKCASGYYCLEGSTSVTQYPCPAGRFGSTGGLTAASCSGACQPGYFCPVNSTSDKQELCGQGYYCPAGTSSRLVVEPAYCGVGASVETYYAVELCLELMSLSPSTSPTAGGGTLSVYGSHFDNVTVSIGDKTCAVNLTLSNLTYIACTIPRGIGTLLDVTVQSVSHSGLTASLFNSFAYGSPSISKVQGCINTGSATTNCDTHGGMLLTIIGSNFGAHDDYGLVLVDNSVVCTGLVVVQVDTMITCSLPAGTGSNISVAVFVGGQTSSAPLLSYALPSVTSVDGCKNVTATGTYLVDGTVGCPRNDSSVQLTIHGSNFGPPGATILVGGQTCLVAPGTSDPHTELNCYLPPGSGASVAVNVIQNKGAISTGKLLVGYEDCPRGTANIWNNVLGYFVCQPCEPGTYTDDPQEFACESCAAGYFSPSPTECQPCVNFVDDSTSLTASTSVGDCFCPNFKELTPEGDACRCPPGMYYVQSGDACAFCPQGTYESTYSYNAQCSPCPSGSSTSAVGATDASACTCKADANFVLITTDNSTSCVCAAGYRYDSALDRCEPCGIGEYSDAWGRPSTCLLCTDTYVDSTTADVGTTSVQGCICKAYHYLSLYSEPTSTGTIGTCKRCPTEVSCPPGTTLSSMQVKPGYWRTSEYSTQLWECDYHDACPGGNSSELCADGYEGHLCGVCSDDYASGVQNGECVSCSSVTTEQILVLCFAIVLPLICLMIYAHHKYEELKSEGRMVRKSLLNWCKVKFSTTQGAGGGGMLTKVKILLAYYQILGGFNAFIGVDYPTLFQGFLGYLLLLNFNFLDLLGLGCVVNINFFTSLLVITITPIVVLFGIFLAYILLQYQVLIGGPTWFALTRKLNAKATAQLREDCSFLAILLLYLVFPGVSAQLVAMFGCVEFDDGGLYLRADYSIDCHSTRYKAYLAYTMIMIVIYPIGVIALFTFLLYRFRYVINPPGLNAVQAIKLRNSDETVRQISFLFEAYQPQFWWFEIFESIRRLALTAIPMALLNDTATQLILVLLVCLGAILVYVGTKPYVFQLDNTIGCTTQIQLFALVFIGLMIRFDTIGSDNDENDRGLGIFLFVLTNVVVISGLAVLLYVFGPAMMRLFRKCFRCLLCLGDSSKSENRCFGLVDVLFPPVEPTSQDQDSIELNKPNVNCDKLHGSNLENEPDSMTEHITAQQPQRTPKQVVVQDDEVDSIRLTEWGEDFTPQTFDRVLL